MIRTYTDISKLNTFEERFNYLKLDGSVGFDTFGFDRYLNQQFYHSPEWKKVRREVIIRDNGCDLGIEDHDIFGKILIHHMNPITEYDLINKTNEVLNPEYLICVSQQTHNAIHYGNEDSLETKFEERRANDTCPWKQ